MIKITSRLPSAVCRLPSGMNEITRRYARALVEAAEERGAAEALRTDCRALLRLIESSGAFQQLLADPVLGARAKRAVLDRALGESVHRITRGFLLLLAENRRERLLGDILRAALDRLGEREGIATAQVVTATELTPEQRTRLSERLAKHMGWSVRLETSVDPAMGAGFRARLGDTVFDGSLAGQLRRLRAHLRGQRSEIRDQ